ncbi:MAG: MarR family transcriptional regulator, partial [Chloroflexi bacterium]
MATRARSLPRLRTRPGRRDGNRHPESRRLVYEVPERARAKQGKERSRAMKSPPLSQEVAEAVQAYLALGDAIRLASLPGWIVADLTISQLKALGLLEHHGTLAVSELARSLSVGNPAASILVQQLVDQALVERSEDARDRRRTLVRLTTQGADLISG